MTTKLPCILIEITQLLEDLKAKYKSVVDPDEFKELLKRTQGNALFGCTESVSEANTCKFEL